MCIDPVTMAAMASTAGSAGTMSTILSIGSTVMGGLAQYQSAKANQKIAKNNARMANDRAQDALRRGEEDERMQRRRTAQLMGSQRAAMAASGVALDEGSPLSILADTAELGELDALTIRRNSEVEAWEHRAQARDFTAQASMEGNKATTSLLTTGMTVGRQYYDYKQKKG